MEFSEDAKERQEFEIVGGGGAGPLFQAAAMGDTNLLERLLASFPGKDIDMARAEDGATPTYVAAEQGHAASVRLLLKFRPESVDQPKTDGSGNTPLLVAVESGHREVVEVLLGCDMSNSLNAGKKQCVADVNRGRADIGATPLLLASSRGHARLVLLLLEAGANPNLATTNDGAAATPLSVAASMGFADVAELLLRFGAAVEGAAVGVDERERTALANLTEKGEQEGIEINSSSSSWWRHPTPLWSACRNGHTSTVAILLAHGGDPNRICDADGTTPRNVAEQQRRRSVLRVLEAFKMKQGQQRVQYDVEKNSHDNAKDGEGVTVGGKQTRGRRVILTCDGEDIGEGEQISLSRPSASRVRRNEQAFMTIGNLLQRVALPFGSSVEVLDPAPLFQTSQILVNSQIREG